MIQNFLLDQRAVTGPTPAPTATTTPTRPPASAAVNEPGRSHNRCPVGQSRGCARFGPPRVPSRAIVLCPSRPARSAGGLSPPPRPQESNAVMLAGTGEQPEWSRIIQPERQLIAEATDNALLVPKIAAASGRVRGAKRQGVRAGTCRIWWDNYNSIWVVHSGAEACRMGRLKQREP